MFYDNCEVTEGAYDCYTIIVDVCLLVEFVFEFGMFNNRSAVTISLFSIRFIEDEALTEHHRDVMRSY